MTAGTRTETANYAGAYLNFATSEAEQVLVKVASGDSYEAAQKYLDAESAGWSFDAIKKRAEDAWMKKLNAIEVKGGTEKQRLLFYSNFFHSLASPRLVVRPSAVLGHRPVGRAVKWVSHVIVAQLSAARCGLLSRHGLARRAPVNSTPSPFRAF